MLISWQIRNSTVYKEGIIVANIFGHKEYKFDFLGKKKIWYLIAALVIIPGMLVWMFMGLNLGIDFTGGSILQVGYESDLELSDVRQIVTEHVSQTPSVNETDNNQFLIRTEELDQEESQALIDDLSALGEMTVLRSELIGPIIGSELLRNARWALFLAAALMLGYITLRFKFNYALTAIVALLHDVLVIISVFAILRIEVDSAFIATILTIVGYSINNTIVIFDRIRENSKYSNKKSFAEKVNLSINQTLTRTINTVVAVLILLVCLMIFGGATTKMFIFGLSVGMVAGFFSSVFLVGPILTVLQERTVSGKKNRNLKPAGQNK